MLEVALYRDTKVFSRAVKFFTRSPYSHSAFLWNGSTVIDIQNNDGVCIRKSISETHNPGVRVDIYRFDPLLTECQEQLLWESFQRDAKAGYKYDYSMVARFVPFVRLFVPNKSYDADKGEFFCSDWMYWRLAVYGIFLFNETQPYEVPPDWFKRSSLLKHHRFVYTT